MNIVMRELQIPPPPPGTARPFALADINILQAALSKGDLQISSLKHLM
jgi:hypothetical protein